MSDVFKAIADPTRRKILLMLAEEPNNIGEISDWFEMSRPAVAKHLKILQNASLITIDADDADGRQRNCYAQLEALKEVDEYITELEAYWKSKLKGLNSYLAKKSKK